VDYFYLDHFSNTTMTNLTKHRIKTAGKVAEKILSTGLNLLILYWIVQLLISGVTWLEAHSTGKNHTSWDVVLECQKISAQATNEEWGYKSCLESLQEQIEVKPRILTI